MVPLGFVHIVFVSRRVSSLSFGLCEDCICIEDSFIRRCGSKWSHNYIPSSDSNLIVAVDWTGASIIENNVPGIQHNCYLRLVRYHTCEHGLQQELYDNVLITNIPQKYMVVSDNWWELYWDFLRFVYLSYISMDNICRPNIKASNRLIAL